MAITLAVIAASPAWPGEPENPAESRNKVDLPGRTVAAANVPNAIAKAGVKTRVAIAWDCDLPSRAPVVWARADHGTISVNAVREPHCGRSSMNLTGIFYTSAPGFKGTDKVYVMGFLINGKIDQTYTVLVK